jgi:bacteriocin-like protein
MIDTMRELTIEELESVSGGIQISGGVTSQTGQSPGTIFGGLSWALEGVAKVAG